MSNETRSCLGGGRRECIHRHAEERSAGRGDRSVICQRYQPSAFSSAAGIASETAKPGFASFFRLAAYMVAQSPASRRSRDLTPSTARWQNGGRKAKRFCSDKCRMSYWNRRRRKDGKIYAK